MLDVEDFEAVFPENAAYTSALISQINQHKKTLGGQTFLEKLLNLLHIKANRLYPPSSPSDLHRLHTLIVSAPLDLQYKHSLVFYMLKDLSLCTDSEQDLAAPFAEAVHLEKRFWTFVEGLWLLDHLSLSDAVNNLCHPSIIPTFPDEILGVLLQGVHTRQRVETGAGGQDLDILPLAYFNCANPPLARDEVRVEFCRYMADRGVTSCLEWIRSRPAHEQRRLLEILAEEVLDRRSFVPDADAHYTRADKAVEFVGLFLSEQEEQWIESFLTEGKGRGLRGAADTVQMRRLATGRLSEVVGEARGVGLGGRGRRVEGLDWEGIREGVGKGLGPRREEKTFHV